MFGLYPEVTRSPDGSIPISTGSGNFILAAANPDVPNYDDSVQSTLTLVICSACFVDNAVPFVESLNALDQPSVILDSGST